MGLAILKLVRAQYRKICVLALLFLSCHWSVTKHVFHRFSNKELKDPAKFYKAHGFSSEEAYWESVLERIQIDEGRVGKGIGLVDSELETIENEFGIQYFAEKDPKTYIVPVEDDSLDREDDEEGKSNPDFKSMNKRRYF